MARRKITRDMVLLVLGQPEQSTEVRPGRLLHQSRMAIVPGGRVYLVRVFVDVDRNPPRVVTAYRTTRFTKYGSSPP